MPYALVSFESGLVAGLADGQLWGSRGLGDAWRRYGLEGDALAELHALARGGECSARTSGRNRAVARKQASAARVGLTVVDDEVADAEQRQVPAR